MFTVVTDLGSAHCLWFANGVEKMFVGSEQIKKLAKERGKVPDEKLILSGLPIRHDFASQADIMGDRMSPEGKEYQRKVREELELPHVDRATILVMGGGEGVGSLSSIVNALYVELVLQGIDALILVVCGRNEKLKKALAERDWSEVLRRHFMAKENRLQSMSSCGTSSFTSSAGCMEGSLVTKQIRRILSTGSLESPVSSLPPSSNTNVMATAQNFQKPPRPAASKSEHASKAEEDQDTTPATTFTFESMGSDAKEGKVAVVGLGFVTRMAEYSELYGGLAIGRVQ
jgi:hypothetical protein